jgi:hypothetical protein
MADDSNVVAFAPIWARVPSDPNRVVIPPRVFLAKLAGHLAKQNARRGSLLEKEPKEA